MSWCIIILKISHFRFIYPIKGMSRSPHLEELPDTAVQSKKYVSNVSSNDLDDSATLQNPVMMGPFQHINYEKHLLK